MFVILSGSSGAGKNTIINQLLKDNKNYKFLTTYTTREMRENEVNGVIYNFISKEAFQNKIKNNEMIEHEIVHGNFMGTAWKEFNDAMEKGFVIFKDLGVQGTFNINEKLASKTDLVKIFLYVPKRQLIKRLIERGEKNIKLRMKRFNYENSFIKKYDYVIQNNIFHKTCNYIKEIIRTKCEPWKIYPIEKKISKINDKKIGKNIERIKTGKTLKPVKVAINENGIFLLNGIERYIASVKMQKDICKFIVNKNIKNYNRDEKEWKKILLS